MFAAHNASQLIDAAVAESDSEDDEGWNYVKGEEANKENCKPSQLSSQVRKPRKFFFFPKLGFYLN